MHSRLWRQPSGQQQVDGKTTARRRQDDDVNGEGSPGRPSRGSARGKVPNTKHHCELQRRPGQGPGELSYSDADLNADPETSKSVSGRWIEFFSAASGQSFPLSWEYTKQASTGGSTAETETVAFSHAVRREAIPTQMLLDEVLPRRVEIACRVDNMQTIQAVTKGYSKKLRHLPRTQRVCLHRHAQ